MSLVVRPRPLAEEVAYLNGQNRVEPSAPATPSRRRINFRRQRPMDREVLLTTALRVAQDPKAISQVPERHQRQVDQVVKAVTVGSSWTRPGTPVQRMRDMRPMGADVVAQRAHAALGPSSNITPLDIENAMRSQGMDWVEPFAPGKPLVPYYGYNRRPRQFDYRVGRNIGTQTRPDRLPYATLLQLYDSYDVSQICTRHAIQDLRSMRVRFEAMDGEEKPVKEEIQAAKAFWRRPDGQRTFRNWVAQNQLDLWRYDAAPIYRQRDRAGRVISLKNVSAPTIAPMVDYFGDFPDGDAPAYQQFIQGVPWDWLRRDDIIYEPFWPQTESPFGTPPLETVLINANTDVRLQLFFLDFFTKGQVPEMFAMAPEGQNTPDDLAEWQETYDDWTYGDQAERWGLRWLPHGTELEAYKPQVFDPDLAEYVMRRTVAAYQQVPQDLGILEDVNRAVSETQVDTQFRLQSLPTVGYYEDICDAVTQDDLDLPVQMRFDTGREKEDRLMEAQAHQIYVSIGAEGVDEVREKILGYPIDPLEKTPRFWDSPRIGVVPLEYIWSVAGDVDPLTGAPRPGTVVPREFVMYGAKEPDPTVGSDSGGTTDGGSAGKPRDAGPKDAPGQPLSARRTKVYPEPLVARRPAGRAGQTPAQRSGPGPRPSAGRVGLNRDSKPGYGNARAEQALARRATKEADPVLVAERADLTRWRRNAVKAVDRGWAPREFTDHAIRPEVHAQVWTALRYARTRDMVEAAFKSAKEVEVAGIALVARDTEQVLMVQRVDNDKWEIPSGHLDGREPLEGALFEFREETGATLPKKAEQIGTWTRDDGEYQGFVFSTPKAAKVELGEPDSEEISAIAWRSIDDLDDDDVRGRVRDCLDAIEPMLEAATKQMPTCAGICVLAADTGRVLMLQRSLEDPHP